MEKSIKDYCKEAKKRLKSGFWENYQKDLSNKMAEAEQNGISQNAVKEYFVVMAKNEMKSNSEKNEEFYNKVKKMLIEEGEVSNAIGRLTDKEVFDKLNYEERQRYTLSLSEQYLKAVERFNREKQIKGK